MSKVREAERAVIEAAVSYIREFENPAPDLLYRNELLIRLSRSVREYEETKR